ncbi:MAG: ABC transporter ATP-binding protein [Bordetella sp.]|nr:ABC transporter ATP-binding protein [Bordetella sp.]
MNARSQALLVVDELAIAAADGRTLVQDVSFALEAGQTLGIVGESGSGKSLTCRAVLGLLPPGLRISAGDIRWRGQSLRTAPAAAYRALRRAEIGAVFQDPGSYLNPASRIGAQLAECVRVRAGVGGRAAHATALALLEAVGIQQSASVARRFPHELSGGMQQRVLIAMALCGQPALLIADEVTTALDVVVQHQVITLLARHKAERDLAMLMVSHDLALVSQVCDHILVMKDGAVVEQGERAALLAEPAHPYTRLLIDTHLQYGLDAYV